jgi:TolB protein
MDSIFIFTTAASLVEKFGISSFADIIDISSDTKFLLTKDESKIIFNCSVNEPGYEGPPGAIFVFDRKMKTTKRISPKGYWFSQPFLKGDRVYFSGSKKGSQASNVYSIGIDGSGLKLELSNCSDFTSKLN